MTGNKHIERDGQEANRIFDNRSLAVDYRTLVPLLQPGMTVLDVGCGTGAISKDVAMRVGPEGLIVGLDNTKKFIESGKQTYQAVPNLHLHHMDLFAYEPEEKFDLVMSARVLLWLQNPLEALMKIKSLLKPGGWVSILDYNHEDLEWNPAPPSSMQQFYGTFLRWRAEAGMNNRIAEDLANMLAETGFAEIKVLNSDEHYNRSRADFLAKVGIWAKVAGSTQMVEEGYLDDDLRLTAIEEYSEWVSNEAMSMTMKLNEARGRNPD